jgi:hypothetical protein
VLSILSWVFQYIKIYIKIVHTPSLNKSNVYLAIYGNGELPVSSFIIVHVCYKFTKYILPLLVVSSDTPALLRRARFNKLAITVTEVNLLLPPPLEQDCLVLPLQLSEYASVIQNSKGPYAGPPFYILMSPDIVPVLLRAGTVPLALQKAVGN